MPIALLECTKTKTAPLLPLVLLGRNVVLDSMEVLLPSTSTESASRANLPSSKVPHSTRVQRVPLGQYAPRAKKDQHPRCLSIVCVRIAMPGNFKRLVLLRVPVALLMQRVVLEQKEPHQAKPLIGLAAIASVANIKVKVASLARLAQRGALARWEKK